MSVKKSRKSSCEKPRRQARQLKPNAFPASHSKKVKENLNNVGRPKKKHSPSTTNNVHDISWRWVRYCENIEKRSRYQHLRAATYDDVILFLKWNLDNLRSRKRSSIFQKFKHWRQLHRKQAKKDFDEDTRKDINDVCSVIRSHCKQNR